MRIITTRELKNHAGEVIRSNSKEDKIIVTLRGKPAAVILPIVAENKKVPQEMRDFKEAWEDIESSLKQSEPKFGTLPEAFG